MYMHVHIRCIKNCFMVVLSRSFGVNMKLANYANIKCYYLSLFCR